MNTTQVGNQNKAYHYFLNPIKDHPAIFGLYLAAMASLAAVIPTCNLDMMTQIIVGCAGGGSLAIVGVVSLYFYHRNSTPLEKFMARLLADCKKPIFESHKLMEWEKIILDHPITKMKSAAKNNTKVTYYLRVNSDVTDQKKFIKITSAKGNLVVQILYTQPNATKDQTSFNIKDFPMPSTQDQLNISGDLTQHPLYTALAEQVSQII